MQRLVVSLLAVLAVVTICVGAIGQTESETRPTTMMSRLKVGQQVRALSSTGGGYTIEIPNDQYIKTFERKRGSPKYVTSKITEIGSDCITISSASGGERTIAFHAINVIVKLPEAKAEAEEDAKK